MDGLEAPASRVVGGAILLCAVIARRASGQRATDTGDPGFLRAERHRRRPRHVRTSPIFDRDCARATAGARLPALFRQTYANVLAGQRPGDASSSLVVVLAGRRMYALTGDAVTRATMVFRWMVYYNAAESLEPMTDRSSARSSCSAPPR